MTKGPAERSVVRRPGGRAARVRARILAATTELVARDGIAGFRYEEVAELAGVHKTSVYRNWPDRATLVKEALLRFGEDMASLAETGELRRDLVDFLVALADGLATPTGRALALVAQSGHESAEVRRTVDAILAHRVVAVQRRVDRAVEQGELPPVDGYFFGELLCGPMYLHVLRGPRPFTREDAERITDVVLAGVRATGR
ncbi:TetR/AcrR family transcriptional regulator [Amycolatopsis cihanbeyliensis]|uniref:TetR family transcriptional regulator n=1 Tax=Amycolatopsis cihanbeyliensis TaxID=1128664 RepID=A0A542DQT2_AMYCI|nr:TetR/AcrR family transcriptional regulator [Amycolatopsis cihanbeyliensis]TQJ05462.1 TetR family transcriptional regulator [Amycolatopsis cihanbeyliensis]